MRRRSPIVWTPISCRASPVTFPTPHSFSTGSGSRNSTSRPYGTTVRPSGLFMSEAIFATNLEAATPADTVSPVSAATAALIFRAISTAPPKSRSVPVTSRNASSMESASTRGENLWKIPKTRSDISLYRPIRTGRKTPWGQRRLAAAIGWAERTPNRRASYEAAETTPRFSPPPTMTGLPARPGWSCTSTDA